MVGYWLLQPEGFVAESPPVAGECAGGPLSAVEWRSTIGFTTTENNRAITATTKPGVHLLFVYLFFGRIPILLLAIIVVIIVVHCRAWRWPQPVVLNLSLSLSRLVELLLLLFTAALQTNRPIRVN